MSDLLTSLDVVNQAFKKSMRGYDPAEVDEFLDRVAECIQVYVQKTKDHERTIEEMSEKLHDYEHIKGSLHEALLMAQRTAEEKVVNASRAADDKLTQAARLADERLNQANFNAESILAEARLKAERIIADAEAEVAGIAAELQKVEDLRNTTFSGIKALIEEVATVVERAESTGKLQIPGTLQGITDRFAAAHATFRTDSHVPQHQQGQAHATFSPPLEEPLAVKSEEAKRQDISEALSALGIDPSLLNANVDIN
jgi:DivIVA domain